MFINRDKKKAYDQLSVINSLKEKVWFIHFSTEVIGDNITREPLRISSICLTSIENETQVFSIFKELNSSQKDINLEYVENCEKVMINRFVQFLVKRKIISLIGWNINTSTYSIQTITEVIKLHDIGVDIGYIEVYDLKEIITLIYGKKFISRDRESNTADIDALLPDSFDYYSLKNHQDARKGNLILLAEKNKIVLDDIKLGLNEAIAFANKSFNAIERSSQKKSKLLREIYNLLNRRKLKLDLNEFQKFIQILDFNYFFENNFGKLLYSLAIAFVSYPKVGAFKTKDFQLIF